MTSQRQSRLEDVDIVARAPRGTSPDSRSYRLENVATTKQRLVFVGMQIAFLVILLSLSVQIIAILLSPYIGSTALAALLVVYCTSTTFWQIGYVYRMLQMKRAVLIDARVPSGLRIAMVTTLVPSREFELLRGKLEGMIRVDRCGNTIDCWVLDEEDDPRVKAMIREFNRRYCRRSARIFHFTRKHRAHYNEPPVGRRFKRFQQRQKGGNINAWLDSIRLAAYDVITFLDLDHVPKPQFYRKVLPYFRDRGVAFVQGPESFRNRGENFITRAASFERDTFFGLVHRSYFGLGMPVVVGSHTTFRTETIQALGGFYPVHLTEDYLIMLQLRASRQRGIFVDEVLAVGELPSTWSAYLGQQYRWASGGLDLLLRYLPGLLRAYTWKEKLYYFALLNYYAWGTFYVAMKGILLIVLLVGLALHLAQVPIVGIFVFSAVAAVANYLWERQFFIEREQQSCFVANAVMNNFLGCHYFVALLKALVCPNRPFHVTAKSGARGRRRRFSSFLLLSSLFVAVESAGLAAAWVFPRAASGHLFGNLLVYPLLVSAAGNLFVLLLSRRLEHEQTDRDRPLLRVCASGAAAEINAVQRKRERTVAEPRRRFSHA